MQYYHHNTISSPQSIKVFGRNIGDSRFCHCNPVLFYTQHRNVILPFIVILSSIMHQDGSLAFVELQTPVLPLKPSKLDQADLKSAFGTLLFHSTQIHSPKMADLQLIASLQICHFWRMFPPEQGCWQFKWFNKSIFCIFC